MTGDINSPRTSSEQKRPAKLGVCVAYDGSVQAQVAVRWAAAEAVRRDRPLRVVHVVDVTGMVMEPMAAPHFDDWPGPLLEAGRATADEGVDIATWTAPAVRAKAVALIGSPTQTLVEESRRTDLMVLGTRGRGDFSAACLGSVSMAVAAHAFCPVVILRGGTPPIPGPAFPVVVGVDGSESSAQALKVAADVAAQAQAQLRIVSVWTGLPEDTRMAAYASGMSPSADSFADVARDAAEHVAEQAADAARKAHPELDVTRLVVEGYPASVLGPVANDAGLLVVGSRGRGAFTGLVLGSVSHGVVQTAHCPVMVVRMPKTARHHEHDEASMHVLI
jgi:nucleotide-binding universal stress UspA family protein